MTETTPGVVFAIGGAEAKLRRRTVLRAFVRAAGGHESRIVVIPTASSLGPEVMDVYRAVFTAMGSTQVDEVRPDTRAEAHEQAYVDLIDAATGIFMTGGNQMKLTAVITGTPVGDAIRRAYDRGAVLAGTSAGCSIMADHMIAFGSPGATPKARMSQMAAGLGIVSGVILDQHFQQRNRYGRLMSLVAQSPSLLGIGVDEDTAAVIRENRWLSVLGHGGVTIIDGSNAVSDASVAQPHAPLLVSGAVMHILPPGSTFDLQERVLVPHRKELKPNEQAEVDAASASLAQLARDIASEGANPTAWARTQRRRRQ